jgi:YfiH family protein
MLIRHLLSNNCVVYLSPLLQQLGVRHAFSTRLGGTSPAPFDSMNLGNPNGCSLQDTYDRIWENYRLLQTAVGLSGEPPCRVHQVHGDEVVRTMRGERFDNNAKADAIVSDDSSRVISVRVADCVPVLLAGKEGRTVAAVHAGWRGVVAGVVPAALQEMHVNPSECVAAIGPCISAENFEVGEEVLAEFSRAFGDRAPISRRKNGKGHVDLREAIRLQLLDAGLLLQQIDTTDRCTYRDADEFFSHRRENGTTGRMAAIIAGNEELRMKSEE